MKRLLINIFLLALSLSSFAEGDVVLFYLNDGSFKGFYKEEIDSIVYSHYDTDSIWHSNVVVQDVWSNDSVCRIPVNKIDSICYSIPDPVYKPQVIRLDERYMPYISSVDGLGMKISPNIPDYLRPKPGDVLLYEGSNDVFPDGFAGKVSEFSGETLECESVTIEDVYDEVVFMGRYALAQENTGNGAKYHAKSVMRKNIFDDVIDYIDGTLDYIEDVSVGDFSGSPEIPNIKMGIKVKFGDVTAAYSEKLKTTMFVEFRYSANPYYPILYSKLTTKVTTEQTAKIQYSKKILDLDPETDEVFKGHEVEWFSFSVPKDEKTGKTTDQIIIINKNVPVPQFPLFSLGIRFGVFQEAKVEGELSYTFKGTSTNEYTSIYSLDKRNMFELTPGELVTSKISPEPTYEHIFEGDVKGSFWAGAIFGVTAGFGGEFKDDKYLSATVKEDLEIKIGPYGEIDANLKISDGIIDKSWYSALHDTKVKLGVKAGVNLSLTAKGFGCSATWDQLSLEPQKLLWEKNCYLFPDFTKPTYKRSGNSLTCTSKLTRSCMPNHVGFRLYDENGICQTKYQEAFYSIDTGQEFAIGETFTGLDFEKHRYRIVPITALFAVIPLEIPAPNQTDALCPDSNHPHLIDMGLPSGTEWQCSNLYADEPTDGGGYYQWGAPYKSTSYTSSYVLPSYSGSSYQGSANDAATANLGSEYATPTKAQFEELWSSCTHTIHKSNWGYENYGMYLKSKSGADLYLPFAGYMKGTSPVDANVGYYVVSDNSVDKGATKCPVYVIGETIHQCSPASWYGYSVRPISGGKQSTDCSLQLSSATIDFGTVSVGASTTKTVVLTNTGNAAATVSIDDEYDDISFNMGSGGVTIAPGQQFTLEVTYTPSSVPSACPVLKLVSDGFEGGYALIYTDAKVSGSAPDTGTHEYVDLGLPSGTLWATCNVGANSPEESGDYFAWGETSPKEYYNWETYKWCNGTYYSQTKYCNDSYFGTVDNKTTLDLSDDAAHVNWGGSWRMPTKAEQDELREKCTWTWTTQNGVNGRMVTGPNGNSIFLPASGLRSGSYFYSFGIYGMYWSSSLGTDYSKYACYLSFDSSDVDWYSNNRYRGQSVRPVCQGEALPQATCSFSTSSYTLNVGGTYTQTVTTNSDGAVTYTSSDPSVASVDASTGKVTGVSVGNATITATVAATGTYASSSTSYDISVVKSSTGTHEYVDLGLSVKWATCNVGANSPEEYGDYFAWGETSPKEDYSWETYKWCNGSYGPLTKYCVNSFYGTVDNKTTLDLSDDAAHVNWGGSWRMPTGEEQDELCKKCTWTWTTQNGVYGRKVTGPNGNSIFLPAAGYRNDGSFRNVGSWGEYWSSSLYTSYSYGAYYLCFGSGNVYTDGSSRYNGQGVRAVCP